jgi:oxygen-independent coproporphyrinogen-3 oxidase
LSAIESALQQAQQQGWLDSDLQRIKPTARGFDFLSDLQALFLKTE